MKKLLHLLTANLKYLLLFYFLLQLSLLLKFPITYSSDSGYYFKLAEDCVAQHAIYPLPQHLYEDYVIAPLYINVLTFLLLISNSSITIGLFNIVLNFVQLYLLFRIAEQLAGEEAAKIAVILYMLYLNNLGLILVNLSDMFFTTLIMGSIWFWLCAEEPPALKNIFRFWFLFRLNSSSGNDTQKQVTAKSAVMQTSFGTNVSLCMSGFLCAASIAVRPVGWALALAYVIMYGIRFFGRQKTLNDAAVIFSGFGTFVLLFGIMVKLSFGEPVFSSDNGPLNILIGANDRANGAYQESVLEPGGIGYIPESSKLTYHQKQEIWKDAAYAWITHHPVKWILLMPGKIVHIFVWDDIAVSRLVSPDYNLYKFAKGIVTGNADANGRNTLSSTQFALWCVLQVIDHLFYYLVMCIFIFGLVKHLPDWFRDMNLCLLLLFVVIGIGITITAFGDARYKYPYMFIFFLFDAILIVKWIKGGRVFPYLV